MLWKKKDYVRIVFGFVPKRMRVECYVVNICNVQCTGIVNLVQNMSSTTPKTALFDGNFPRKVCGTVIPHRDFSRKVL